MYIYRNENMPNSELIDQEFFPIREGISRQVARHAAAREARRRRIGLVPCRQYRLMWRDMTRLSILDSVTFW